MAGDAPLLERLAQMPAVPAADATDLVERLEDIGTDPLLGPLFAVDDEGDAVVNPLVPTVLQQFQDTADLTCYAALLEGLTGIWNAAVRAAVVARLRAAGLLLITLSRSFDPGQCILAHSCVYLHILAFYLYIPALTCLTTCT